MKWKTQNQIPRADASARQINIKSIKIKFTDRMPTNLSTTKTDQFTYWTDMKCNFFRGVLVIQATVSNMVWYRSLG